MTEAGQPLSQEILVLRRSASTAVIIVARRAAPVLIGATSLDVAQQLAETAWSVEQITYELHAPAALSAASTSPVPR